MLYELLVFDISCLLHSLLCLFEREHFAGMVVSSEEVLLEMHQLREDQKAIQNHHFSFWLFGRNDSHYLYH